MEGSLDAWDWTYRGEEMGHVRWFIGLTGSWPGGPRSRHDLPVSERGVMGGERGDGWGSSDEGPGS